MRFCICPTLIATSLAGCGSLSGVTDLGAGAKPERISHTGNPALDQLNQGYSLLYRNVSAMKLARAVLRVKFESRRTERVVTDIATYAGTLSDRLAELPATYPNLRIDLQPLPEIERRAQAALAKDRLISFAPIVGLTGVAFERGLLLTLLGGLHQVRFLCQVMAEQEPNAERMRLLLSAQQRTIQLTLETEKLLNEVYYKTDGYDPEALGPQ